MFPMAPQASPLQTRLTVEENGFLERFRVLKLVLTQLQRDRRPPAKVPGVAAMVMGATTHGRSAAFFRQNLIDV